MQNIVAISTALYDTTCQLLNHVNVGQIGELDQIQAQRANLVSQLSKIDISVYSFSDLTLCKEKLTLCQSLETEALLKLQQLKQDIAKNFEQDKISQQALTAFKQFS